MTSAPAIPHMQTVASSNIAAVGYDGRNGELHVRFKNGGHYAYEGVTVDKHREMLAAESIGKYLAQHIKPAHKVRKLENAVPHGA